ncbi:MAG: GH3 auxin-responsive promoter family protein [Clostridia bacterium]|nr:GH3 auxin-responsive promoter family protein [Clostridia bacterium]
MSHDMTAAEKQAEAARHAVLHLEEITKDPMKVQEGFLLKLLDDNKDTEYGRKYRFSDIHSVEEYRQRVPVTTYDDYAPYIERMSEKGERDLITAYDLALYNKSSGSIGAPKRIPMTKKAIENFMMYNASYEAGILARRFGGSLASGRTISLTLSNPDLKFMADGVPFGSLSDTSTLQAKPFWTRIFTSPIAASFAVTGTDTRYLHARYALIDPAPTRIACSFMSFTLEFLRYIESNWEMLVDDIEKGTIDESIELPEDVRAELIKELVPDPARAKELHDIFSQGFDEPFVPKVWKNLKVISGAATGTFKKYAAKMQERYTGNIPISRRGVSASEGAFSVSIGLDSCDSVLLPDSVFFEFLPEGEEDISKLVTLDKLEKGKKYELYITNLSGFYRYSMKDVFLVTGMYNNTPTIEFQYRADRTVSIMGEKTTETAVRAAAEMTADRCGFELVESSMYPDIDDSRYVYILEIDKIPQELTYDMIRDTLEGCLAEVNPSMGDKVKKGICAPTGLLFSQPETFILYREMLQMHGYSVGQTKPVTVITNEFQRRFFLRMTDDFEEIKGLRAIKARA